MAKASKELGDFAVLTHSGYRYEYHMTVQARSAHEARAIFKRSGDWRADNFRVRDDRKHGAAPAA
ncbi:hypothetical protein [Diaphorobacter sp. LR2014-1]|uniref:hypothetical protein n=1 Tax=Diaphorobacter sp. LR2014-1 TaxID=1933219 RepID=UPI0011AFBFD8|nr:hypothetical protein [Diaphorobacter sp. LR2014-1]